MGPDYLGLLAGYGAASVVFWLVFLGLRPWFLRGEAAVIRRPWIELLVVFVGVVATLGVGQLYVHNMLLPERGEIFQSLNQVAIFAPALLALVLLRDFWWKNFLRLEYAAPGIAFGVVPALIAFTAFAAARHGIGAWPELASQVVSPGNISVAVQVLFEDILIAALAARLLAATNVWVTIGAVAALFAAAHIPAMLAEGANLGELWTLVLDTGLGVMLIGAIIASRNVWWFWPLHTVMDLTQFLRVG